jgi:hypothetical protein
MCHHIYNVHCNMMTVGLFLTDSTTQYCPLTAFGAETNAFGSRMLAVSSECLDAQLTTQFNTRDSLVYVPRTPQRAPSVLRDSAILGLRDIFAHQRWLPSCQGSRQRLYRQLLSE